MIVQFNLLAAPSSTISPFNAQRVAFCTRASEAVAQTIDGTNSVTPVLGWLSDSAVVSSCSGDLSQGSGFFAEAIDGTVTIPDVNISKAISAGTLSLVGADVFVYDGRPLVQLRVAAVDFPDGDAVISLRSRTYTLDAPLWASRGVESGTTDPVDPSNPSTPAYFEAVQYTQFAGAVFGSRPVSIRTSDAPKSFTLARWAWSADHIGGTFKGLIATAIDYANICSPFADAIDTTQIDNPSGVAVVDFWTKLDPYPITTHTERDRFYSQIAQLMADGYSVIITDGNWFCDLSKIGISCVSKVFQTRGSGPPRDTDAVRITIPNSQFPPWGADPASIKLIASKNSISVATSQVELQGAAYNGTTVALPGADSWDGLVQSFTPANSGGDGLVSVSPITPLNLCCIYPLPIHMTGVVGLQVDGAGTAANIVAGSTDDINDDPATPYALGGAPISYGWNGTQTHTTADLRLGLVSGLRTVDADFVFFDSSYRVSVAFGGTAFSDWAVRYGPPMQGAPELNAVATSGSPYSFYKPLQTAFDSIKWRAAQRSIGDANANPSGLYVQPFPGSAHELSHAQVEVFDVTAYAVRKIGNANIYATVYPFWTSKDLNALDTASGGDVAAGGAGTGAFYGENITWTKSDFRLDTIPGVVRVRGLAWGMTVGIAIGSTTKGFARYASADYDFSVWGASVIPTRCRKLGSYFVVTMEDGTFASSLDGVSWWLPYSAGALYDAAFDGTTYIAVGNNHVVYTNDPTTPHLGTISGAPVLRAVVWVQPSGIYSGGGFFLAGGDGGKIYKATSAQAAAGTWTTLTPAFSEDIHELAANGSGIVAATPNGIWSTKDCVTWKKVATVTPGASVTSEPHLAAIALVGGGTWVYANGPQVLTSVDSDPYAGTPKWTAWSSLTPNDAMDRLRSQFLGAKSSWNPIVWNDLPWYPNVNSFGVAFDPPTTSTKQGEQVSGGFRASDALGKICQEWWNFAGEMPSARIDGSSDAIDIAIPSLRPGDAQDVATSAAFQFAPFAGEYTASAYVQNTDKAYVAGNDAVYFGGWGASDGLTIWTEFRNAYLASGVSRPITREFDSIHDSGTLADLLLRSDADLGPRLRWICRPPRFVEITVSGNDSGAAIAFPGCRYKVNQTLLQARDMEISGTGYGVVVNCEHNYTQASHHLTVAFPPQ